MDFGRNLKILQYAFVVFEYGYVAESALSKSIANYHEHNNNIMINSVNFLMVSKIILNAVFLHMLRNSGHNCDRMSEELLKFLSLHY